MSSEKPLFSGTGKVSPLAVDKSQPAQGEGVGDLLVQGKLWDGSDCGVSMVGEMLGWLLRCP